MTDDLGIICIGVKLVAGLDWDYTKTQKEAVEAVEELITQCFTADTLIHTKTGVKKIKDIMIGDEVLSQDIETGKVLFKSVLNTYHKTTYELVKLHLNDEIVETTKSHLIFTESGWWNKASDIAVGECILTHDGDLNR